MIYVFSADMNTIDWGLGPMSEVNWKNGDVAVIREGWEGAGKHMRVLGPAVFVQQHWVPVLDPDEEDPTFHKAAGLFRADPSIVK